MGEISVVLAGFVDECRVVMNKRTVARLATFVAFSLTVGCATPHQDWLDRELIKMEVQEKIRARSKCEAGKGCADYIDIIDREAREQEADREIDDLIMLWLLLGY